MLMLMLILMLRLIWCRSGLLCFGFGLPERIRAKAWMKVETADQKRPISVEIIIRRLKEDAGPQCSRCTPRVLTRSKEGHRILHEAVFFTRAHLFGRFITCTQTQAASRVGRRLVWVRLITKEGVSWKWFEEGRRSVACFIDI